MSKMNDFLMDTAYTFQEYHPIYSFEECMDIVCNMGDPLLWNYKSGMKSKERWALQIEIKSLNSSILSSLLEDFRNAVYQNECLKEMFDDSEFFLKVHDDSLILFIMTNKFYPIEAGITLDLNNAGEEK